jgi:hypothetical protein
MRINVGTLLTIRSAKLSETPRANLRRLRPSTITVDNRVK